MDNTNSSYNSLKLKVKNITNLNDANSIIDLLSQHIIRLEKENSELKFIKDKCFVYEKNNKELKEEINSKNKTIESINNANNLLKSNIKELEYTKNNEIRDIKSEKDNYISNTEQKLSTLFSLEKLKETQNNMIENLKQEIQLLKLEHKEDINKKQYEHKNKLDELKKNMLERIKNKDRNVSQINLENMDVSTKLTLLQNHQLLIELEYQSQQIQDLIVKKEALERRLFELEKDMEVHKEVEHILAEKNKTLSNTLKNAINKNKLKKTNSINFEKTSNNIDKNIENKLIDNLNAKIKKMKSQLDNKCLLNDSLKVTVDNLNIEVKKYNNLARFILKIFEEELSKIINKNIMGIIKESTLNNEIFTNINEVLNKSLTIKEENNTSDINNINDKKEYIPYNSAVYNNLNDAQKYSLLMFFIDNLVKILNYSNKESTLLTSQNIDNKINLPLINKLQSKNILIKYQNNKDNSQGLSPKTKYALSNLRFNKTNINQNEFNYLNKIKKNSFFRKGLININKSHFSDFNYTLKDKKTSNTKILNNKFTILNN